MFALASLSISVRSENVSCDVASFLGVLQKMPKEKCVADDLLRSPRGAHTREHVLKAGLPDNVEDTRSVDTMSHPGDSVATFNVPPTQNDRVCLYFH